jgi:hypothetical protein
MTRATRRAMILAACGVALALGACGKVGQIDQPAPLYGDKAKADYQAKQAAAEAKAAKKAGQPQHVPDPYTQPGTVLANPLPGAPPAPNAQPPQGVLPNPMTDSGQPGPP